MFYFILKRNPNSDISYIWKVHVPRPSIFYISSSCDGLVWLIEHVYAPSIIHKDEHFANKNAFKLEENF
jgi:hypothetical protein